MAKIEKKKRKKQKIRKGKIRKEKTEKTAVPLKRNNRGCINGCKHNVPILKGLALCEWNMNMNEKKKLRM